MATDRLLQEIRIMRIRFRRVICVMLAGLLLFGSAGAVDASDLQDQLNDAETKGDQIKEQKDAAQTKIDSLNLQLDSLDSDIAAVETSITDKQNEIEAAEEALTQAKLNEESQYLSMKLRIRYMYENGENNILAVLLEARDMGDLLCKVEYVNQLTSYDRDKLIEYQDTRVAVANQEAELQTEYNEFITLQADLEEKQGQVQSLITEQTALLADLETSLGDNGEIVSQLRTRLAAYNASVAAAAAAKQEASSSGSSGNNTVSGTGQFTNPCPAGYLSSGFGYRTFDNSFHKGIDLACGEGNPIYAADSGTVIIAGYSATAGNWVVINHGNGLVTKYMHASRLYVSAGQSVSIGQQIAAVGTTGSSSGNHLHFQVELNGIAVNPYLYL